MSEQLSNTKNLGFDERVAPSRIARAGAALAVGLACWLVGYRYLDITFSSIQAADFTPLYLGARAVIEGADPYVTVANRTDIWLHLLFYPLPATLVVMPLAWLPMATAAVTFFALGSAWLAYAVTRGGWWWLLIFASGGFWWSLISMQWTPLLMAAAMAGPTVGLALAAKPTMALPLFAMQTTRRAVVAGLAVGLAILVFSVAIQFHWPVAWYRTVRASPIHSEYVSPALTLLGAPIWLALPHWRDWRARLLIGMALTPLNALTYSHLPLLLIARTRLQLMILALGSWIGYLVSMPILLRVSHGSAFAHLTPHLEPIAILAYYFPPLLLVLSRPGWQLASLRKRRLSIDAN